MKKDTHQFILICIICIICILLIIYILHFLYTLSKKDHPIESFTSKCIVQFGNGKRALSTKSDLPCSHEIPFPYISNTQTYKKNDKIKIVSGPIESMNNRICDIFKKYANNIDIYNVDTFDNYSNIDTLLNGDADIAFSTEDILYDYRNSLNYFKDKYVDTRNIECICSLYNQYMLLFVPLTSNIRSLNDINNRKILVLNNETLFKSLIQSINIEVNYEYNPNKNYTQEDYLTFDGFFLLEGYDKTYINKITDTIECTFIPINIPNDRMSFYFPMFQKNKYDSTLFIDYNNKTDRNRFIDTYSSRNIIICRTDTQKTKIIQFLNFIYNFIITYRNKEIKPIYNNDNIQNNIRNINEEFTYNQNKNYSMRSNRYAKNNPFFDQISIKRINVDIAQKNIDNRNYYTPLDELSVANLIQIHSFIPLNSTAAIFYEKLGYLTHNSNRACALIAGKYECTDKNLDAINITDLDELFNNDDGYNSKVDNVLPPLKENNIGYTNTNGYICLNIDGTNNGLRRSGTGGVNGTSEKTCESSTYVDGVSKMPGVWDKQCIKNEDCPFYKKNTNYPNTRGGCINGFCEMPVNITRIGFTKYIDENNYRKYNNQTINKPYCYNCKGNTNTCCDQQESPDYAFEGDLKDRYTYQEQLSNNNLEWSKHN